MNTDTMQAYVTRQLENLFPSLDGNLRLRTRSVGEALRCTERCISQIRAVEGKGFQPLNSGHYATFLYFLSRIVGVADTDPVAATKLFLLNKALNGIDLFHEVAMPQAFLIGHTVGMVFAKANYGNYAVFHQGCTVGRHLGARPTLHEGVVMYPGSMVIGNCIVRANSILSPGVRLINQSTPGDCLVFEGKSGMPVFKEAREVYAWRYFFPPSEAGHPTPVAAPAKP